VTRRSAGFKSTDPRPLTREERKLLEFLLSSEFLSRDQLLAQVEAVKVVGACECGCGTIDLRVESQPKVISGTEHIAVEAYGDNVDVLLFTRNGLLTSLELAFHDDHLPRTFPKPENLKLWKRS
jgi:hypothetical protein